MTTVNELLSSPPNAPAFHSWFEKAKELSTDMQALSLHMTLRLNALRAHFEAMADQGTAVATADAGVTFPAICDVETWLERVIIAADAQVRA